jgi:hypothetical protein
MLTPLRFAAGVMVHTPRAARVSAARRVEQGLGPGPGGPRHLPPCAPPQRRTCEARSRCAALGEHVHTPSESPPVEHIQHPCTLGICGWRAGVHSVAVARDAPSDASLAAGGRPSLETL